MRRGLSFVALVACGLERSPAAPPSPAPQTIDVAAAAPADASTTESGPSGRVDADAAAAEPVHMGLASVRQGEMQVSSGLSPDVVRRILRRNFGRFRLCYDYGLLETPTLEGRVVVKLVIDAGGNSASVADDGSDLPDSSVVDCVTKAFAAVSFPRPSGNASVTVTYRLLFTPPAPLPPGERLPRGRPMPF